MHPMTPEKCAAPRCLQLGRSQPMTVPRYLYRESLQETSRHDIVAACAGALRQVVADDPFAQRVVTALAPTLGPIVQYAARTPFFSNIITAIASSDDPVVSLLASAADVMDKNEWP